MRSLMAMLHYFIDGADDKPESAATAAQIYLQLLRMPGSGARQLQQGMITRSVFRILERWTLSTSSGGSSPVVTGSKRKARSPSGGGKVGLCDPHHRPIMWLFRSTFCTANSYNCEH
jgi:hypothetical protein